MTALFTEFYFNLFINSNVFLGKVCGKHHGNWNTAELVYNHLFSMSIVVSNTLKVLIYWSFLIHKCQWIRSSLVHLIADRQLCTKPLPQLELSESSMPYLIDKNRVDKKLKTHVWKTKIIHSGLMLISSPNPAIGLTKMSGFYSYW